MTLSRRELMATIGGAGLTTLAGCAAPRAVNGPADLARTDAIGQAALLERGELSATELLDAFVSRFEATNPALNAVIATGFDTARSKAAALGSSGGLAGVPLLLKDLNEYPGMRYTSGSRAFLNVIGQQRSEYTKKIDAAGLIVAGKTNTPEFGLLPTTEPLALGPTRNPWNTEHSAGGSSGGAAAAVAARMLPLAQASDGGGSIRIPAAACGIFGLKPTRGRFPDQNVPQRGWPISIRHAVSMSVRDNALMLALTEADAGPLQPVGFVTPGPVRPLRIALSTDDGLGNAPSAAMDDAVHRTAAVLETLGHRVEPIDRRPDQDPAFPEQFLRVWAMGAAGVARFVAEMSGTDPAVSGLLEPWTLGLAEHFAGLPGDPVAEMQSHFQGAEAATQTLLHDYDAWLTPTVATAAPRLGELAPDVDFETLLPKVTQFAAYTPLHNVAGTPAISIPAGFDDGLPLGVQIAAAQGREALLLELAYQLEEAAPWADRLPPINAVDGEVPEAGAATTL
ncbi:MAG: amidase family protein [Pseudomonadota bacterium]